MISLSNRLPAVGSTLVLVLVVFTISPAEQNTAVAQEPIAGVPPDVSPAPNGPRQGDPHIEGVLYEAGIAFTVDDDGGFDVTYETGDGRTQRVFVVGETDTFGGVEFRDVFTYGYETTGGPLPPEVLAELMGENSSRLGDWQTRTTGDGKPACSYEVTIPAYPDAKTLTAVMEDVATQGDRIEAKLLGTDEW